MSMGQSDLGEFDDYNREQTGRGTPVAERAGRPTCDAETKDGSPCQLPVAPGCDQCQKHLDTGKADEDGPDYSHQLAIARASGGDLESAEETRCPECREPVPSMYKVGGEFHQCPECGHRED